MEVKLALLILVALTVGGEALKCNVCKKVMTDGEVDVSNQGGMAVCSDESTATCHAGLNDCLTVTMKFKLDFLGISTEQEQTIYGCGDSSEADSAVCETFEGLVDDAAGFADFTCSIDKCQTDLCNAGKTAQVSFFTFTALIAIFGLFF